MIYLATDGSRYRIGFSRDIPHRLFQFSAKSSSKWTLLFALDAEKDALSDIKDRFSSIEVVERYGGSFYPVSGEVLSFFATHEAACRRVRESDKANIKFRIPIEMAAWIEARAKLNNHSIHKELENIVSGLMAGTLDG